MNMSTLRGGGAILRCWATAVLALAGALPAWAQGTVTFDHPWLVNGTSAFSLYYDASGMWVRVSPAPPQPHDSVLLVGVGLAGHPDNGTPHVEFSNTLAIPQSVIFSLTNGSTFGVTSVDLADIIGPSTNAVSISFNGFMADGSMVSTTFTTAAGGTSAFDTFLFGPSFASGLTRLETPSAVWAMDNLVFVLEPGAVSLLGLGLLSLAAWRLRPRQR